MNAEPAAGGVRRWPADSGRGPPGARCAPYKIRGQDHAPGHEIRGLDGIDEQAGHLAAHGFDRLATLVNCGVVLVATGESSKPTTATSAGTRRPAAARTVSAPAAIRSDAAKTASMSGRAARSRFIAAAPLSWVKSPTASRFASAAEVGLGQRVAIAGAGDRSRPPCPAVRRSSR